MTIEKRYDSSLEKMWQIKREIAAEPAVTEVCRIWHASYLCSIGFPEPHGGSTRRCL